MLYALCMLCMLGVVCVVYSVYIVGAMLCVGNGCVTYGMCVVWYVDGARVMCGVCGMCDMCDVCVVHVARWVGCVCRV